LLQTAFLVDRWGAQAILGPEPDFRLLVHISHLLHVYNVFTKRKGPGGLKSLTQSERRLVAEIMALEIDKETDG